MIVDYDKKMEVILDFYEQVHEIFDMVCDDIAGFERLYDYDLFKYKKDSVVGICIDDPKRKVESRIKQLLIQLGRVGEYALKYILLLEQLRLVPNQTYDEFIGNTLYTLGEKNPTQNNSTSGYYISGSYITENMFDDIKNERNTHKKQPLHDYAYLFFILKKMFPDIVEDIFKVMNYNIKSDRALNSKLPQTLKDMVYFFPQVDYVEFDGVGDEDKRSFQDEFEKILNDSGDIFIRLRYIENNPDSKDYSLVDIFNIMDYLVKYIELVHNINEDDINKDITAAYNKDKCINHMLNLVGNGMRVSEYQQGIKKIEYLFSRKPLYENVDLMYYFIFKSEFSVDEIEELLNNLNLSNEELYFIVSNISYNNLKVLYDKGVTDFDHIFKILTSGNIDEILNLSKEDVYMTKWLDIDTLNKLKAIPSVYAFYLENPDVLGIFFGSMYFDKKTLDLFIELVSLDEIKNNPTLVYGLDFEQIRILSALGIEVKEEKIKENVKNNLDFFKDNSELYTVIPFMLDCDNTKNILDLLNTQGLDMTKLDELDSTVFCLPFNLVSEITIFLNSKGFNLIDKNNDLYRLFGFVEAKRRYEFKKSGKNSALLPLPHRKNDYKKCIAYNKNIYS